MDNHDEDRIASKLADKGTLSPRIHVPVHASPASPSVYYGGEWGVEGRRTRTSDDDLRPAISMDQARTLHCELTDLIAKLGHSRWKPEFHAGRYQELLLTNRQYAYARWSEIPSSSPPQQRQRSGRHEHPGSGKR